MNWYNLALIVPVLVIVLGFIGLIDIKRKRKFPNGFIESIFLISVIFPPVLGFAFYYYYVMKPNKYAK